MEVEVLITDVWRNLRGLPAAIFAGNRSLEKSANNSPNFLPSFAILLKGTGQKYHPSFAVKGYL